MNVNLNLYRYFYEVAKYGSYTKAAEAIMISQPSLSYSVKVLENQLGIILFRKKNNKIELTEVGQEIYQKLEDIFKVLSSIEKESNEVSGILKLGVRSAYANKVLPPYISELNKIYPNLYIEVIVAPSKVLEEMLKNNAIDVSIDEYDYGNNYVSFSLEKSFNPILFTTPIKLKQMNSDIIDEEFLKKQELYVVEKNRLYKDFMEMYPDFNYIKKQSTSIVVNEVRYENKIGLSQKELILDELHNGILVELQANIKLPKSNVYVNYLKKINNKKVIAFSNFMKEHVSDK